MRHYPPLEITMSEVTPNFEPAFPAPPATAPAQDNAFFGRFGMRAGWSLAIFLPLMFLFSLVLGGIVGLVASGQFKAMMAARAAGTHIGLNDILPLPLAKTEHSS
jgi:hypothetical protein